MKKYNVLKWIVFTIAIIVDVFILVNSLLDGPTSSQESGTIATEIAEVINTVKPETITAENFDRFHFDIRKAFGHFGLFGVAGVFNCWSYYLFFKDKKIGYILPFSLIVLGFGLMLAGISELAQFSADGRGPAFLDVGIDFFGYFIGVLLMILIFFIRKSHIFSKAKND